MERQMHVTNALNPQASMIRLWRGRNGRATSAAPQSNISQGMIGRDWLGVGFSGSRCPDRASLNALASVVRFVPVSAVVLVGCARGIDGAVRDSFEHALVLRAVHMPGLPHAVSLVTRSTLLVWSLVRPAGRSLLVSLPSRECPPGLLPTVDPRRAFRGLGSGSWATLALAVGHDVPALLYLPAPLAPPRDWGFVSGGGGWYLSRRLIDISRRDVAATSIERSGL
jgi:hypothetical protein